MRLFIAINFTTDIKNKLSTLCDELRSHSTRGRFSLTENLHLTLAFLGECDEKETAAVKVAMSEVIFDPFDLEIEYIGRFKRNGSDIWWAGVHKNNALTDLHKNLISSLRSQGFNLEKRKYNPHITLGREIVTDVLPYTIEPFGEKVSRIDLMKSEQVNGKLTYTSIFRRGKWKKPIVVEPYNSQWAAEFERRRLYLMPYINDLIVDIHHVGSTSVPGLSAKPIIDFDIEIASMDVFPEIKERLEHLGFRHEGDYGISGREVFKREKPDSFMQDYMYVCPSDSIELKQHLYFRDALRANPSTASEYGALKSALAEKCGNDIDAYIDGKAEFIRSVLEKDK